MGALKGRCKECRFLAVVAENEQISPSPRLDVGQVWILFRGEVTVENLADRRGKRLVSWMERRDDFIVVLRSAGLAEGHAIRSVRIDGENGSSRTLHPCTARFNPFGERITGIEKILHPSGGDVDENGVGGIGLIRIGFG